MTIKKRLIISNLLMLLVSALMILAISAGLLVAFLGIYRKSLDFWEKNDRDAYLVQIALAKDVSEMLQKGEYEQRIEKISSELNKKGYHIEFMVDGNVQFSNQSLADKRAVADLPEKTLSMSDSLMLAANNTAIVKYSFILNDKTASILAVNSSYSDQEAAFQAKLEAFISRYIFIILLIAIFTIMLTNGILSSMIAKSMTVPLKLLSNSAKKIKEGNLNFEITYKGNDEFKQVCADFDDMRLRLKQSVETQLKYEDSKKELVAGISHDLRTPLTAIKGYVEGLRDGIANTEEKRNKYLDTIYQKSCDMDVLVDHLFLFSKLDTGKFPFYFQIVEIKQYLEGLFLQMNDEYTAKGTKITFEIADSLFASSKTVLDIYEMGRVMENIIENSNKYKHKSIGNVHIFVSSRIDFFSIRIADDGPGVPDLDLTKLFDSFFRSDPSRTNPAGGSGLGLAIAREIVEAHGGSIKAENDKGLVIIVELPIKTDLLLNKEVIRIEKNINR